jgi:ABC-type polysaccharide/polyol phosphate export permease
MSGPEVSTARAESESPIRVFWAYRSFIWRSALYDLRYRYVGSALGIFWNVLIPLAQILIYAAVFSGIMPVRLAGAAPANAFTIYLCAGLLPWIGFSECVARGTNCFLENANYLKKLPIPEQVFVACNAVAATLSLGISMALLFLLALVFGWKITWAWSSIAPVVLLLQALGFGLGLALGSLNVFFRDIGQALPIVLQLWMWLTPVVYLKEILPSALQATLPCNPAFPFVDALHAAIVWGEWPTGWHWAVMLFWAAAALLVGYFVLGRLRPEIRDVL